MKQLRFVKFLAFLLLAIVFVEKCHAQSPKVPQKVATLYEFFGVMHDSVDQLPKVLSGRYTDTACIRYQRSDSNVYVWTGNVWKCISCASSSATPGTPLNSVQFNRNSIFTGSDSMKYAKGLQLRNILGSAPGANDFYGLNWNPTGETVNYSVKNLHGFSPNLANWYESTTSNPAVNFGLLQNDTDVVTTMGPNLNFDASTARVIDSLDGGGWRWENNFPTGNDSAAYAEIHLSHFPSKKYCTKCSSERRLISFQATRGIGAKRAAGPWNQANVVLGQIYASVFNFNWSDSNTNPVIHTHITPDLLEQTGLISVQGVDNNQPGFTINGLPALSPGNYDGQVGSIDIGIPQRHVLVFDTLFIVPTSGSTANLNTDGNNLAVLGKETNFRSGLTDPSDLDDRTSLSVSNNPSTPKFVKLSRLTSANIAAIIPTTADNGAQVYDSVKRSNYFWNGFSYVGSSSGTFRFTPTTGGSLQLQAQGYNVVDPASPLLNLNFNLPTGPIDNDFVEVKLTKVITSLTFSGGTVVGQPLSNVTGYIKLVFLGGSWY